MRAVLVTHSHMDHVSSLPFLVENVFGRTRGPLEVLAPEDVLDALRTHLFNDALWPDFSRIPGQDGPSVTFRAVPVGRSSRGRTDGDGGGRLARRPDLRLRPRGRARLGRLRATPGRRKRSAARAPRTSRRSSSSARSNTLQRIADAPSPDPATLRTEMEKFPKDVPIYLYHEAARARVSPPRSPRWATRASSSSRTATTSSSRPACPARRAVQEVHRRWKASVRRTTRPTRGGTGARKSARRATREPPGTASMNASGAATRSTRGGASESPAHVLGRQRTV